MSTADEVREAEERNAASLFLTFLTGAASYVADLETDPTKAARGLETQSLADAIAVLQDVRARLTMVERDLVTTLGQREGKGTGELSDGRQFTIERSSDRKEWDHDDWKRDVRRKVVTEATDAIQSWGVADPAAVQVVTKDGEVMPFNWTAMLHNALAVAQNVHGAQAPKSTALKALGLYAADYCTSSPAGWRFSAVKPTTITEDTKESTDA